MVNKKKFLSNITIKTLLIALIFAGVGTIIIGEGLLIGMQGEVSEPAKLSQEQPAKIVEEEKDEIADWQTYRNEKYNYTIKHPKDWPINLKTSELVIIGDVPYEPSAGPLSIDVYQNKNIAFLNEFKGCQEEKEVSLANLKAWKIICVEDFAGQQMENYFIERNNNLYRISFIRGSEELNKTFAKIIESFDLENRDQLVDNEISNWQAYRNKKYGIEFKYPKDFPFFQQPELLINKIDPNSLSAKICAEGESEGVAIKKIIVGENTFCSYVAKKGAAAGSAYMDYKYSIIKDDKDYAIHFVVKYTSCGVYGDETELKYIECEEFNNKTAPKIINQILSSFKFIEKDETADWQTYRNEEYGFEMKYPEDYKVGPRKNLIELEPNNYNKYCLITIGQRPSFKNILFADWHQKNMAGNQNLSIKEENKNQMVKTVEADGIQTITNYTYFTNEETTVYLSCNKNKDNSIYEQILSSFKFIEK